VRGEDVSDNRRMQRQLGLSGEVTKPGAVTHAPRPEPETGDRKGNGHAKRKASGNGNGNGNDARPTGRVKWFDPKKGFGFIEVADARDLFVHHSNIHGEGQQALVEGQDVEYEIGPGRKGDEAKNVRVLAQVS